MKRALILAIATAATALSTQGCASQTTEEEDAVSGEAAFTGAQCKPVHTTHNTFAGAGTARSTRRGCLRAAPSPQGAPGGGRAMLDRVASILGNTARFAGMKNAQGQLVFSRFTPRAASGNVQDVDVTLNVDHSPSARLRVTRQRLADGRYWLHIQNVTSFSAWGVSAIQPGGFALGLVVQADATGILLDGFAEVRIALRDAQQHALAASQVIFSVYDLLDAEL